MTPALAVVVIVLTMLVIPAWVWDRLAGPDPDLATDEPWHLEPLYRQPVRQARQATPADRMPWSR